MNWDALNYPHPECLPTQLVDAAAAEAAAAPAEGANDCSVHHYLETMKNALSQPPAI